ncbi:hypothetical protein BDY19DRAFT_923643 [Irpex rosettiformis]|uniref:Uncharacterized protein n=1 Tax=Irpex rosettiformis TaxID=378272 RepID=A0ACB8UG85_9APHY|nr:hypothetical protein BDY19DRAFT_923643 [Irpex rosettiformis]
MSLTITIPPIPFPFTISQLVQALEDARTTKYLGVAGLIVLLYDHALTLSDEVSLVWAAPRSFAKYAYLFNRYMVVICLLGVTHEMSGLSGNVYSELSCRRFLFTVSVLSLFSIAIGNILVLLRVILLWDHRPIISRLMTFGFVVSFSAQATLMVITLIELIPGVYWASSPLDMCITTYTTPKLIGVWASPMLFEVLVIFSTVLNAFDRPHQAELRVAKTLYRDGIIYFCAVTFFRTLNLIFSIIGTASTSMRMVFFAWSCTTIVLSRALLNIRKQEVVSDHYAVSGRTSPFGIRAEVAVVEHDTSWVHLKTIRSMSP